MKGIILAGGLGTRLYPATHALCKQLLPVFDKPMIYYPLSVLMLAGIKEILIISTYQDLPRFQMLFGDGSHLGLELQYKVQEKPRGLAEAFIVGKEFIGQDSVALILGDNIFYGHNFSQFLQDCVQLKEGALIFGYQVSDPERYGVVEFDEEGRAISIEEKPKQPKSHFAVPGLYFYDNQVVELAANLKPSKRGEIEITDLNLTYLKNKQLRVKLFGRGFAWLDTGTFDALQQASVFVQTVQERQAIKIACLEEIAFRMGFIDEHALSKLSEKYNNEYGKYLHQVLKDSQKFEFATANLN